MLNSIQVKFNDPDEFAVELKREMYNGKLVPVLRATVEYRGNADFPTIQAVHVRAGFVYTKHELLHLVELQRYFGDVMLGELADSSKVCQAAAAQIAALEKLAAGMVHKMEFAAGVWQLPVK